MTVTLSAAPLDPRGMPLDCLLVSGLTVTLRGYRDCKCLMLIDLHKRTCNSWTYQDYIAAHPEVSPPSLPTNSTHPTPPYPKIHAHTHAPHQASGFRAFNQCLHLHAHLSTRRCRVAGHSIII